jgi:hypothetical protein
MYLIDRLTNYIYQCNPDLLPLSILKGLGLCWTLKYGIVDLTAPALITFGLMLAGSVGNFAGAKKYADFVLNRWTEALHLVLYFPLVNLFCPGRFCLKIVRSLFWMPTKRGCRLAI